MLSDVKRVSGLPKKGVALVSLNLFGNQWDPVMQLVTTGLGSVVQAHSLGSAG